MRTSSSRLTFRPLATGDLPMLVEWLSRPHVAEWWDSPATLAEVEAVRASAPSWCGRSSPLFADPTVTRVQTDPAPDNPRAIRCYQKAGFRAIREIDAPDGRALLMYCDR